MTNALDTLDGTIITPQDLAQQLGAGSQETLYLLDVRDPEECAVTSIAGAVNIPLATLPERLADLPVDRTIITICHHGVRSMRAAVFLRQNGFDHTRSLHGGMDMWSCVIDPSCPRY